MSRHEVRMREPAINMPAGLVASIALLLAIQGLRSALSDLADLELLLGGGFVPGQWSAALGFADAADVIRAAGQGIDEVDVAEARQALAHYLVDSGRFHPWTILSHAVLHGSWMHVGLNVVWLAAFGTPVVRRLGPVRSALLALASALGGAVAYWAADPLAIQILIGASGVVSGFMGAAALFVFARGPGEPATLRGFARNRNALLFIALWFVLNLATGVLAGPLGFDAPIAWQAHIGGLVAGMAAFPFLDPWRHGRWMRP